MKTYFLYILRFKNEPIIKVGISSNNDFSRVRQLARVYDIDLQASLVVRSTNERTIKAFEDTIKTDYSTFGIDEQYQQKYQGLDGHTELRHLRALDSIMEDIQHKQRKEWLNIEVTHGIKIMKVKQNSNKLPAKKSGRKVYVDSIPNMEGLYEVLDLIALSDEVYAVNITLDNCFIIAMSDRMRHVFWDKLRIWYPDSGGANIISSFSSVDDVTLLEGSVEMDLEKDFTKYPFAASQLSEYKDLFSTVIRNSPKFDPTLEKDNFDFSEHLKGGVLKLINSIRHTDVTKPIRRLQ